MRTRLALFITVFLLAASCGVSRNEDSADADADADIEAADDATTVPVETTVPPTIAPPTTAPPADVAVTVLFADGSTAETLHGTLNEIVVPTQENSEFIGLVYQGIAPPGFDAVVLSQTVLGQVMDNELDRLELSTSDGDIEEAKSLLVDQLVSFFTTSTNPVADAERLYAEVPYLSFIIGLQARQIALSNSLATTAGEGVGDPCVRHILLETEEDAASVVEALDAGGDFAELAAERSTGPTGPNGGDLGCAPAGNYVVEFADAVTSAEIGAYVGPVQTEFGWHVILVEGYEVNGDQLVQDLLTEGLVGATITVDERVGSWDTELLTIVPVGS